MKTNSRFPAGSSFFTTFLLILVVGLAVTVLVLLIQKNANYKDTPKIQKQNISQDAPASDPIRGCVTVKTISGMGSGFFIRKNKILYVVTCRHVIIDEPFIIINDIDGNRHQVEKIYYAPDRDVALLQVKEPSEPVLTLELAENIGTLPLQTEVSCYGDSEGMGVVVRCEGKLLGVGPINIETDTPFVSGNSGGPMVLKDSFNVIAAASCMTRNSENNKWAKGSRFETDVRRFSVRIDNLNWDTLKLREEPLVAEDDFEALNKIAEKAIAEDDLDKAACFLFYCAGKDNAWALNKLGEMSMQLQKDGNFAESATNAVKIFKKVAENKLPEGLLNLGICYLYGLGIGQNTEEGFRAILEAAELGNPSAYAIAGSCYQLAIGVTQNFEKAFSYYQKGAMKNNPRALNALGDCYYYGWGTEQDYKKALEAYQKAANQNDAEGQMNLGFCCENGIGRKADAEEAFQWYLKAAEKGNSDAESKLGDIFYAKHDYKSAALWYEKGRLQNHPPSYYSLGLMIKNGEGVARDPQKGIEYIKKAAELDYPKAQLQLGLLYASGDGVEMNQLESVFWFSKAADNNDAEAMNYLGIFYQNEKSYDVAFKFYSAAANSGNSYAKMNLAACYNSGFGTPINEKQAAYWYEAAANDGLPEAQRAYGNLLFNGRGVERNYQEALAWYKKAAEQNDAEALAYLGYMYAFGFGVTKNSQQAFNYYLEAAKQNHEASKFAVAYCLYKGEGTKKDVSAAWGLYKLLYDEGGERKDEAYRMMQQCEKELRPY